MDLPSAVGTRLVLGTPNRDQIDGLNSPPSPSVSLVVSAVAAPGVYAEYKKHTTEMSIGEALFEMQIFFYLPAPSTMSLWTSFARLFNVAFIFQHQKAAAQTFKNFLNQ